MVLWDLACTFGVIISLNSCKVKLVFYFCSCLRTSFATVSAFKVRRPLFFERVTMLSLAEVKTGDVNVSVRSCFLTPFAFIPRASKPLTTYPWTLSTTAFLVSVSLFFDALSSLALGGSVGVFELQSAFLCYLLGATFLFTTRVSFSPASNFPLT